MTTPSQWTEQSTQPSEWPCNIDSTIKEWDDSTVDWADPDVYWDGYTTTERCSDGAKPANWQEV